MALENVDPSIIGRIQQPNYLQGIAGVGSAANALLGAQAQRQQIQANQATSEAFKAATNPETGQTDWNHLRGLIANGPAAYNLPQINQAITHNQTSQQDLQAKQFDLAMKKQGAIMNRVGALAMNPKSTPSDAVNEMVDMVQSGLIDVNAATQHLGTMPKDPAAFRDWIKSDYMKSLDATARLQATNPAISQIGNGQGTILFNSNQLAPGGVGQMGFVQNQLSPAQLAENVTIVDPVTGQPRIITKAQQLQMNGGGMGASQGGAPAPAGGSGYTGRYPGAQQPTQEIGLSAGLGTAQQSALTVQGSAAAKEAAGMSENAATSPTRINLLQQARTALSNPNVQTGPGAEWRNTAKSFFAALSPDIAKAIGASENIKDFDEFKKIMNNYASQNSFGGGTNERLNVAISGNANPEISKLANQDILNKTIAIEKMNQAKNHAWQNSGLADTNPQKFQQWSSQWNKNVNPDVFIADELTKEQQAKMFQRMKPSELAKFKQDYASAYQSGLVGK